VKYLFIDGGFLDVMVEKTQRHFGLSEVPQIRFEQLCGRYDRTFYYGAYPVQKKGQSDADFELLIKATNQKFRMINLTPNVHTREGITKNRRDGRREQKGVDILLAIDVLKNALNGTLSEAHIMTTDSDFFPLLEALRDTRAKSFLHCFPDETSEDLMHLADRVVPVNPFYIMRWAGIGAEGFVNSGVHYIERDMNVEIKVGRVLGGRFRILAKSQIPNGEYFAHVDGWNSHLVVQAKTEKDAIWAMECFMEEMVVF